MGKEVLARLWSARLGSTRLGQIARANWLRPKGIGWDDGQVSLANLTRKKIRVRTCKAQSESPMVKLLVWHTQTRDTPHD